MPGWDWPTYRVDDWHDGDELGARATMLFDAESGVLNDPKRTERLAWKDYDLTRWGTGRPELLSELGIDWSRLEMLDDPTDQAQR